MRIAIAMMCMGLCPFLFGLAWAASTLSYARHHPGTPAPASVEMFTVLVGAYAFALVVSGAGTFLSYQAAKRSAVPVFGTSAVRILVAVVLALPVFLYATVLLPSA